MTVLARSETGTLTPTTMFWSQANLLMGNNPTETTLQGWGRLDGKAWDCGNVVIPDCELHTGENEGEELCQQHN